MNRYCVHCGDDILEGLKEPDQALVSEVWERLCIHVWLHHPEFITKDDKGHPKLNAPVILDE